MKTAVLLGLAAMSMAAMASVPYEVRGDRVINTPSEPRLRHARKVHERRYDHLMGAWLNPEWSSREAAKRNAEMELERRAHKARKLEEGRARVAMGIPRIVKIDSGKRIFTGVVITHWG